MGALVDALDAKILLTLGLEPFVTCPSPMRGLKPSTVAEALGTNVQLVKDRIARMEDDGIITGYGVFPNLRHFGLSLSTFHMFGREVLDEERLSRVRSVDGITALVWFMGPDLCIDLVHASEAERRRRLDLVAHLTGLEEPARALLVREFPHVERRLSPLDWRILLAMHDDARRPLSDVAEEIGVTAKTVRNRLQTMRDEGSIDEYVQIDFQRLRGMIPFQLAIWYEEGPDPKPALLDAFGERLLAHFHPPPGGYADYVMRIIAETPADVQAILRSAMKVEGVQRAEAMVAAGGSFDPEWVGELLTRQVETAQRTAV